MYTMTLIFSAFYRMNTVSVRWASRMLTPNCTQVSEELLFHNLLFRIKRAPTTSILSQNNKACNGTNELVKIIVILLHCVTPFFPRWMQTTDDRKNAQFIYSPKVILCMSCYYKKL